MPRRISFDFFSGVDAKDYTEIAKKEHLQPLEVRDARRWDDRLPVPARAASPPPAGSSASLLAACFACHPRWALSVVMPCHHIPPPHHTLPHRTAFCF
jgi:hypothetical protein